MKSLKCFASVLLLASAQWVAAEVTITIQPKNTSVSPGATVRFAVSASSTEPSITYKWWFKDAALDVKANPTAATYQLFLTNVTMASAGPYYVIASDSSGAATSQVAALTVDPTFTKITTGPVVNDLGSWEAPTWWDYDNDGFLDLYVANASVGVVANVHDALYHNNRDGSFTRMTTNAIGTRLSQSLDGAVGDFNNDGYEDLLAVHFQMADDLYRNDDGVNFTRLTKDQAGPPVADSDNSVDAGWADYDRDGFIDLFVANSWNSPGNDRLYRNIGNSAFSRMTTNQVGMLVDENATTGPCAWLDYDNDGWPDLWVGTSWTSPMTGRHSLYHNKGDGSFSRVLAGSLTNNIAKGVGLWADYDNDGYLDLFLTSFSSTGTNSLHRNLGGKTFIDVSKAAGVANAIRGWSAAWGDYDNDGYLDLLVVASDYVKQSVLYHNTGDGAFTSVDVGSPLREGGDRVGVAWADYDNDGFLDLLITCGDGVNTWKNLLYHNTGNTNHWLKIKPVGAASNRSAIGAKVRVNATIGGKNIWQTREISGNSGFSGGAGGLLAHFGMGDATNVMTLRIEWPSGNVQEMTDVVPNQFLTVKEVVGIAPPNPSPSLNGAVTLTHAGSVAGATYQWQFGGADLPGQTNRTLVLANVQQGQQGRYSVIVTKADQAFTNYVYLHVDPTFTKITSGPLATDLGAAAPAAWGDFDGDGFPDVFVPRYRTGLSTLYHNNRDGTFGALATLPAQTTPDIWWGALAADFDNDGKLDVLALRWGKPGFLYFNNGDGTFTPSQFQSANPWNAAVADYDRDGLLDVYLSNDGRLYCNNGDRTFVRTASFGGMYGGATWVDYDDDGWAELFCAGNTSPSRVFHNDGTGRLVAVNNLLTRGLALVGAWGDYDNDGRLDLCAAAFNGPTYVYRNFGNGEFERAAIGQTIAGTYNSAAWVDYDNDGFLDLFLTTNGRNALYHNNGNSTFTRIQSGSIVTDVPTGAGGDLYSYAGLWLDYDNNGFPDLYVCNGNEAGTAMTANFLYRNNGNINAWLKVKLIGTASNHDGVGAKVRAQAKYAGQVRWQRRDISAGDALNGNQLYAHFGLGDATNVTALRIEWPSGAVQELENVEPKQFLTVWEPPALKAAIQSDGACRLTVTAQPNRSWRIEASADLETWQELATQTHTTPGFEYTASVSASIAYRFYRVVGE